jgi:hypothetical protein
LSSTIRTVNGTVRIIRHRRGAGGQVALPGRHAAAEDDASRGSRLLRKSLRNLDAIAPTLRKLGARHVAYGARPEHYPLVGGALIAAMATIAGDAWTAENELAWNDAFDVLAYLRR